MTFEGLARRYTMEEWRDASFGKRVGLVGLVDTGALRAKVQGDPRRGVLDHGERQAHERRAQGGRG